MPTGWMGDLRRAASERFSAMAWPTPAEEEWRRTDLTGLDLGSFAGLRLDGPDLSLFPSGTETVKSAAGMVRFENGRCTRGVLCDEWRAKGVRLMPLQQAIGEFEDTLEGLFNRALREADNRFLPWHYAEISHGALLYVPAFVEVPDPFFIELFEGGRNVLSSPHVVVLLEKGARAVVVQHTKSAPDAEVLYNGGVHLIVSEAAALRYYETQQLSETSLVFRHASASLGKDASLLYFEAATGGKLVKTRLDCTLEGSGSQALLNGVYFCGADQHMDIRTVQRHQARSAVSRASYKGAVKDNGRTTYQGLIEVGTGASGTDAFLNNKNLILNDGARSDSIPSLQIGNNDVKCSHGSTTGRIDREHLFYLRSRGLSEAEAREMLVVGYFEDVLGDTPEPFSTSVLHAVRARLNGRRSPERPAQAEAVDVSAAAR